MFSDLYHDIGGKIKKWAEWIFLISAIGAVITGLVMLCSGEHMILPGLLTMIVGPFVAWVSSWILYAFGELVEKTSDNESNTRAILQILKDNNQNISNIHTPPAKPSQPKPAFTTPPAGGWVCTCGRAHQNYEGTCVCGVTKHEAKAAQNK